MSTSTGRRPRRPTSGPGSLLEVCVVEFNTRGYDATSMEDLSRAAGITKSSFYHHFASKEALLRAGLEVALDGLFEVLDAPGATTGTPAERLRYIVAAQVAVLQRELPYVTLLLRVRGNTETERWALERRRAFDGRVAALVREAVEAGELRAGLDPTLAARLLSGLVNSVAEWYRPGRPSGASVPEAVADAAFAGILPAR
ncbi:TetR/AcrR family transcriptional regulator [Pseudonocardia sp. CA-107938]|uniref:TetR/AcrR family transcriptional regulator n=1 Tax=Pseudonocardia sp. CA-107938 TaxID=3240021 RepID=UPI003D940AA4